MRAENDNRNAGQPDDFPWWGNLVLLVFLGLLTLGIVAFVRYARVDHGSYGFAPWPVEA